MDGMESVLNALPRRLRTAGWAVALPLVMLVCTVCGAAGRGRSDRKSVV